MKSRSFEGRKAQTHALFLVVSIMIILCVCHSIASEKDGYLHELYDNEFNRSTVCDFATARLNNAKTIAILKEGRGAYKISNQAAAPFRPIFRNSDKYISFDYTFINEKIIKILHVKYLVSKRNPKESSKNYIFYRFGISPSIETEELSVWCDKTLMILMFSQESLLEAEIFTELNE